MSEERTLRQGLLGAGSIDECDREAYDRAVAALFERKFGTGERALYVVATIGGAAMAMALSALALTEPPTTPVATRAILGGLAAVGLFWAFVCGGALRKGRVGVLTDRRWIARGALLFAVLQSLVFAWWAAGERPEDAQGSALSGLVVSLVFVVVAGVVLVLQGLRESELRAREVALRERMGIEGR